VVTLPNIANYNEGVGGGKTLGWANRASQPFSTDSRPGDVYTVSGGNGSYFISAGAGTDNIAISGGGTSYISAGTGIFDITVGGGGRIVLESDNGNVGSGSATIAAKSVVEVKEKSLGTVKFSGLSGSGTVQIDKDATVEIVGSVASGVTVTFQPGGTGTLILDSPYQFGGRITGLADGDHIVLTSTGSGTSPKPNEVYVGDHREQYPERPEPLHPERAGFPASDLPGDHHSDQRPGQ
jgi:hypothetical protein